MQVRLGRWVIRLLFTHQNDEFVAISIKDWSCAVPMLSRFLPLFFSVGTGIQTVAEVNDLERGLEPTEREINLHKWGFWIQFTKPYRPTAPVRCSMRVNDSVPKPFILYCMAFDIGLADHVLKNIIKFGHFTS